MNWQEHVSNFNKLRAENGISIREYAEHYNLNPNTARRYLRSANPAPSDDHDHSVMDDQKVTPKKPVLKKCNPRKPVPARATDRQLSCGGQTLMGRIRRQKTPKAGTRK
ncbi:hypothetical protein ID855_06065 [Xenorhabdus sp. ZM]|uniref:hypothetical protein n=1 Tax=Xenorhabdus szentirmaii TaxID=290112 RepID=UPI001988716A|nr:hypothetical protein [Xenorhabdus sp. ZM]MBD2804268.1 hypothetical protein [Xenorhabdus sp. ZM]